MDSADADARHRKERAETDANLKAERTRADQELDQARRSAVQEAEEVVEVARDLAEATLRAARARADSDRFRQIDPDQSQREVAVERAAEDGALAAAEIGAASRLQGEADERQRALVALLRLEREATDDGLLLERARADEAVATRDEFLGIVSHDLRNLLGGIALNASLLTKHATPAAGVGGGDVVTLRHSERIQRFTARMNRLLNDLLDVVSLEAGKLHVTKLPLDPATLVNDAFEVFHPSFLAKGLSLETKISAAECCVEVDHERILQVLGNLLTNALNFTDQGGQVVMTIVRNGGEVRFSVVDNGLGIPPDQITAVFERFRQVDIRDRRGLGLGLYIAKSIVEAHGGTIWAETRPEGGAALHFTLPEVQTVSTTF